MKIFAIGKNAILNLGKIETQHFLVIASILLSFDIIIETVRVLLLFKS